MISAEELSGLLASLYAAPLQPEEWQAFMDRLCGLTEISCGYLIGHSDSLGVLLAGGGMNFEPEMFQLYNDYYAAQDPYVGPMLAKPRTGLLTGDQLYDRDLLVNSEIYNDFLRKYELESTSVLMCSCSTEQLEGISLWRGPKQGALDLDSQRLLQMLLPHLQTALQLRAKLLAHEAMHVFSDVALDAISIGTFLVAGDGRVQRMNGRAATYLKEGGALAISRGKLLANGASDTVRLHQLLRAATARRIAQAPGGAIRLLRPKTGTYLQVTVIPVPERNTIPRPGRHALVFISDPNATTGSRAALMRQLYGLTPSESRLADLLLDGLDVKTAAERLRITLETARFHLKRILQKTDTRRQSQLMRLMLSLPAPATPQEK